MKATTTIRSEIVEKYGSSLRTVRLNNGMIIKLPFKDHRVSKYNVDYVFQKDNNVIGNIFKIKNLDKNDNTINEIFNSMVEPNECIVNDKFTLKHYEHDVITDQCICTLISDSDEDYCFTASIPWKMTQKMKNSSEYIPLSGNYKKVLDFHLLYNIEFMEEF